MSFILLGILNSQVSGAAGGSYELIESNILTSSASSVTFSSIPQDYKHLQVRAVHRNLRAGNTDTLSLRMNGVTATNYRTHYLEGTGSSVTSGTWGNENLMPLAWSPGTVQGTSVHAASVFDILDYASTSKNTTIRELGGFVGSSVYRTELRSGLFMSTSAVTSITLLMYDGNTIAAGSRFSLYGIRG